MHLLMVVMRFFLISSKFDLFPFSVLICVWYSSRSDEYCLLQEQYVLPEFIIQLSFPSLITTRVQELIRMKQEKDEMQQNEDPHYNYFVKSLSQTQPPFSPLPSASPSPVPQHHIGKGNTSKAYSKDINHNISNQVFSGNSLSQNYFDFVERLQNEQFVDKLGYPQHEQPPLQSPDGGSGGQKNATIKQTALLNIENAVKDCQIANQQLLKNTAKQLLNNIPKKS
jgi:hypothetical protein